MRSNAKRFNKTDWRKNTAPPRNLNASIVLNQVKLLAFEQSWQGSSSAITKQFSGLPESWTFPNIHQWRSLPRIASNKTNTRPLRLKQPRLERKIVFFKYTKLIIKDRSTQQPSNSDPTTPRGGAGGATSLEAAGDANFSNVQAASVSAHSFGVTTTGSWGAGEPGKRTE